MFDRNDKFSFITKLSLSTIFDCVNDHSLVVFFLIDTLAWLPVVSCDKFNLPNTTDY